MIINVYDRGNGKLVARMAIERVAKRISEKRLGRSFTQEQRDELARAIERDLKGGLHYTTPGCLYCRDELDHGEDI